MAKKSFIALLTLALSNSSFAAPHPTYDATPDGLHSTSTNIENFSPAIHWQHDLYDHRNLIPERKNRLYYTDKEGKSERAGKQDSSRHHKFVNMDVKFKYPTVILEHSALLNVQCESGNLLVTLKDEKAYNLAKEHWSGRDLVFETNVNRCGSSNADNTRTYWKAKNTKFISESQGSGHARISVAELPANKGMESIDLEWGTHTPSDSENKDLSRRAAESATTPACKPPKGLIGKIATANWCERNFDQVLDKDIGFTKISSKSFLPALEKAASHVNGAVLPKPLNKRDCSLGCDPSFSNGPSVNLHLDNNANSPWGPAHQLLDQNGADLYCVDCGLHASLTISGGAHVQVLPEISCPNWWEPWNCVTTRSPGISGMYVGVSGGMNAKMALGLDANGATAFGKEFSILAIPLAGFGIPDIVTIGPVATLDAKLDFDIKAVGTFLAGAGMDIGPFNARYDFDSKTGTSSGWNVNTETKFNATGHMSIGTTLTFPFGVGVGIDFPVLDSIPGLDTNYNVALKDGFGVRVDTDYVSKNAATPATACPGGIEWDIKLVQEVFFDVLGGLFKYPLFSNVSPPLASGCIGGSKDSGGGGSNDPKTHKGTTKLGQDSVTGVFASLDGNLYPSKNMAGASVFNTWDNAVISDTKDRFLHFYSDVMSKYGVSRLRLSSLEHVPKTATMIALQPINYKGDKKADSYVAVDKSGKIYYPVICTIKGSSPKIFLEKRKGTSSKLLNDDLIWSVTGGEVQKCQDLILTPRKVT